MKSSKKGTARIFQALQTCAGDRQASRWYQMETTGGNAEIWVFGDVTSIPWFDSDVSAHGFVQDLDALGPVDNITVHINSYGGEVAEGIAIYNALLAHQANVTTICEGMACSIASVIFMAGDRRVMRDASLMFMHNCWGFATGNADDMRKAAEDIEIHNSLSKKAYARSGMAPDEISAMMDAETWLTAQDALVDGFATEVDEADEQGAPSQSALGDIRTMVLLERVAAMEPCGTAAGTPDDVMERISSIEQRIAAVEERALDAQAADGCAMAAQPVAEADPEPNQQKASIKTKLARILM